MELNFLKHSVILLFENELVLRDWDVPGRGSGTPGVGDRDVPGLGPGTPGVEHRDVLGLAASLVLIECTLSFVLVGEVDLDLDLLKIVGVKMTMKVKY